MALLCASPAGYELARALAALGAELQDAELLRRAVVTARECGADWLVARATEVLLGLGAGDLPCKSSWKDEPTGEELRAAERAARSARAVPAGGDPAASGSGAAAAREPVRESVRAPRTLPGPDGSGPDWDLSAACRKLGTDRPGLPAALEAFARSST
ncbi:hypothetical protein ACWGE1_05545 [Streptomyces sp. NPDC054932]